MMALWRTKQIAARDSDARASLRIEVILWNDRKPLNIAEALGPGST
jgi:hypothetical protein